MTGVGLRERKRAASRARILREAIALFSERGIEGVTVDEIAAAADVGKGTAYNYFKAKEDIIVAFLLELDREALAAMPGLAAEAKSAADALDAAAWSLLGNKADHHRFVRVFLARLVSADGFADDLIEFQKALDVALGLFFENLLARDDVATDRTVEELGLSFKTHHLGLNMLWSLEGPPFATARALTRWHMHMFAKGLEP